MSIDAWLLVAPSLAAAFAVAAGIYKAFRFATRLENVVNRVERNTNGKLADQFATLADQLTRRFDNADERLESIESRVALIEAFHRNAVEKPARVAKAAAKVARR